MEATIGIDDLNLYAGPCRIPMATIAEARGYDEKTVRATGFNHRSVVPPFEDPVTLAVNAARPLVEDAGTDAYGMLIFATESSTDYGKPLSTYAHRYLGLADACRNFEIKHACYGGTAALQMACAWIRSGEARGRKALVVMSDLARRHFGDAAELTAGAAAVAVSVSEAPRVLEVERGSGSASLEVFDVARPTPTGEWGDAPLSLHAYLDLLDMAWEAYCEVVGPIDPEREFRYQIYHTPLIGLVERAHEALIDVALGSADPAVVRRSLEERVLPCLTYNREVANVYSGSLYTSLASLVDCVGPPDGTRVAFFSYGSGSCAEFFTGRIARDATGRLARHKIGDALASREPVDLETYEQCILAQERNQTQPDFEPEQDVPDRYRAQRLLRLAAVRNHHRSYEWC